MFRLKVRNYSYFQLTSSRSAVGVKAVGSGSALGMTTSKLNYTMMPRMPGLLSQIIPSLERNQILIFLLEKYRFHKSGLSLANYASIYFDQAYYIFGGSGKNVYGNVVVLSNIGRLDAVTRTWSLAGELNQGRHGHGVIFDEKQFLIIGGLGTYKTEICIPNGETVSCNQVGEALTDYAEYPELTLVIDDYGNDC